MLLLAEALTIDKQVDEAIEIYSEVLEARDGAGEPTKDIHRAIAPLFSLKGKFVEAAESLGKVLELEDQQLAKVTLYTKIAGNYKKANDFDKCLENSDAAYKLMCKLQGQLDFQTQKCFINLADVYAHFEKKEEAKEKFNHFLQVFSEMDGLEGRPDWELDEKLKKLKEFSEARLAELDGEEEEEYYDEEDGQE